jgi:hypothetical protein
VPVLMADRPDGGSAGGSSGAPVAAGTKAVSDRLVAMLEPGEHVELSLRLYWGDVIVTQDRVLAERRHYFLWVIPLPRSPHLLRRSLVGHVALHHRWSLFPFRPRLLIADASSWPVVIKVRYGEWSLADGFVKAIGASLR